MAGTHVAGPNQAFAIGWKQVGFSGYKLAVLHCALTDAEFGAAKREVLGGA